VKEIDDLHAGMTLEGVVTNVTKFGAFVDVGVHQDGLVHISELSKRYIKEPSDVVKVGYPESTWYISVNWALETLIATSRPRRESWAR
jgi:uncharacterized protein